MQKNLKDLGRLYNQKEAIFSGIREMGIFC
uniref:Uncharacterized protein n=1 Tax=Rhizophora mucronata TaxID=61149 RepID=A0A2P2N418_RHIMU